MTRLFLYVVIAMAFYLHDVHGLEYSTSKVTGNVEDAPIALTSYGPQARLFLGTSTNTRVVTTTSGTVAVCIATFDGANMCMGRRKKRSVRNRKHLESVALSDTLAPVDISASTLGTEAQEQETTGRILFYPATIFTTVTFTAFSDSGTTASVSLACSPTGTVTFCG